MADHTDTPALPDEQVAAIRALVAGPTSCEDILSKLAECEEGFAERYARMMVDGSEEVANAALLRRIHPALAALLTDRDRLARENAATQKTVAFVVGWVSGMLEKRVYEDDFELRMIRDKLSDRLPRIATPPDPTTPEPT